MFFPHVLLSPRLILSLRRCAFCICIGCIELFQHISSRACCIISPYKESPFEDRALVGALAPGHDSYSHGVQTKLLRIDERLESAVLVNISVV